MSEVVAVILAAGMSTRMGGARSKVFLEIEGRSVLSRSLEAFFSCPRVSQVVIVAKRGDEEEIKKSAEHVSFGKPFQIIEGGPIRQASVGNAVHSLISSNVSDSATVLIHDAARCLISQSVIDRVIIGVKTYGAVTAAVPLVDSLMRVGEDGVMEEPLNREKVWLVQTPQGFLFSLLKDAHLKFPVEGDGASDDASLVKKIVPVRAVLGERMNIKITTPEDLAYGEALLRGGR